MNDILNRYGELLAEVDVWFSSCLKRYSDKIACQSGCSACCRGLFDITLMDALYLKRGVVGLDETLRLELEKTAKNRLLTLSQDFPTYTSPWFLNNLSDEIQQAMMPEDDLTPCLLLSKHGTCLVYKYRPMTCRLHGIPLFDTDGEAFSDEWCTLNFTDIKPEFLLDIRYEFRRLFELEIQLFRELTSRIYGEPINEMDTIIPAVVGTL